MIIIKTTGKRDGWGSKTILKHMQQVDKSRLSGFSTFLNKEFMPSGTLSSR